MAKGGGGTRSASSGILSASRVGGSVGAKMKSDTFIVRHPRWSKIYQKIEDILNEISTHGFTDSERIFSIGEVDFDVRDFARQNNIIIGSNEDYMDTQHIFHAQRAFHRNNGLYVGDEAMKNFPRDRYNMNVYFDKSKSTFVYTDGVNKFILTPNKTPKKFREKGDISFFVTGEKLRPGNNEFAPTNHNYIKIR